MQPDRKKRLVLAKHIADTYGIFVRQKPWHETDIHLNVRSVVIAIDNALEDMDRMVAFHMKGGAPDRHKFAGFLAKWIARERPIQCTDWKGNLPDISFGEWMYWVNARFAVRVMQSFLHSGIPSKIAGDLEYWFAFRDERGETLAMIAYCCEKMPED